MAGLLIKEQIARGDLQRCLVVCPGSLAEQWQDELYRRFHLPFEILTNDKLEAARTGNWFMENNLVIARLDKLSRNEDVQAKLSAPDGRWDLVVCDEAHKMSATYFGGEVKYTKRYRLGQLLSTTTRHFLLMTATPHNGKEEDFQLFMALKRLLWCIHCSRRVPKEPHVQLISFARLLGNCRSVLSQAHKCSGTSQDPTRSGEHNQEQRARPALAGPGSPNRPEAGHSASIPSAIRLVKCRHRTSWNIQFPTKSRPTWIAG
jgi:SNF2-related domain